MTRTGFHVGLAAAAVAAAAVVAVALAGGGFGGVALGTATGLVWAVLVVLVLVGVTPRAAPSSGLAAAAACLLALLALTVLSFGWTTSDEAAFEEAVRLAGYLGVFLLSGLLARRDLSGAVLAGLAAGGVLVALVALGSRLLGIGSGDVQLVADLPTAAGRLSFPLGYWNALGALMAMTLAPLCWLGAREGPRRLAGPALAAFPPVITAGYLTSSRGAVLAALIGLAVVIGCSADRRRGLSAAVVGSALSVPALVVASTASGLIDSPGDGTPGWPELAAILAIAGGSAIAILLGDRLVGALAGSRLLAFKPRARYVVGAGVTAFAVLVAIAGPSNLIGDLRAGNDAQTSAGNDRATGLISTSGSGRTQIWESALDAFAEEPVRGIGAGAFTDYWNQHGALRTAAGNAHSEPMQVLSELGLAGFLCFAGFVAVVIGCVAGRVRRTDPGEGAAAAAGLITAALIGFCIDWPWQVPAAVVPFLIAAGMTCGLAPPMRALARLPRVSPRVAALAAIALALPAVWAGAVLAVSTARMQDASDALAEGRLNDAAADARSAAAIQPWAAEPWLQLATIEKEAGNLDASLLAVEQAIDRNGSSLQAWSLATDTVSRMGRLDASIAYGLRAYELGPTD